MSCQSSRPNATKAARSAELKSLVPRERKGKRLLVSERSHDAFQSADPREAERRLKQRPYEKLIFAVRPRLRVVSSVRGPKPVAHIFFAARVDPQNDVAVGTV